MEKHIVCVTIIILAVGFVACCLARLGYNVSIKISTEKVEVHSLHKNSNLNTVEDE